MHLFQQYLSNLIDKHLRERRVVVLYDPRSEFERFVDEFDVVGQGLGGQLLAAAAVRCLRIAALAGGRLLIIYAKGELAASWYAKYGAEPLRDKPLTLVMSLATFEADFKSKGLL